MQIYIDEDEYYPYYFLVEKTYYGHKVDLTEAEVLYCKEAEEAFKKYQRFLKEKVKSNA